jgi:hypothetical protein
MERQIMTQDNMFREVEEDLERQRYEALWKRYGVFVVAAILAIIFGTAGNSYWQTHTAASRQEATGGLAELLGQSNTEPARKIEALEDFAATHKGQTQATLAELHAAALLAKQGNKDAAAKIYDGIATDAGADHAFRQLADLLSVQVQIDGGDPALLQKRLVPLMGEKEPWRFSAMELLSGTLALRSGDIIKAKEMFTALAEDASVPQSLGVRAADQLKLLAE